MVAINMADHMGIPSLPFVGSNRQRQPTYILATIKSEDDGHVRISANNGNNVEMNPNVLYEGGGQQQQLQQQQQFQEIGFQHPFNTISGGNGNGPMSTAELMQQFARASAAQQQQHQQQQSFMQQHQQQYQHQHQQQKPQQRYKFVQNGQNGSISSDVVSAYSELASPDSDADVDNGGTDSLANSQLFSVSSANNNNNNNNNDVPNKKNGKKVKNSKSDTLSSKRSSLAGTDGFVGINSTHDNNLNDNANLEPSSGKSMTNKKSQQGQEQLEKGDKVGGGGGGGGGVNGKIGKATKSKSRKRVNTAEKRASHNAVERMRREQLNERFLDLARLLPTLSEHRRPSKSAIVNASISHVILQRDQRLLAARELRNLHGDYEDLLAEVQVWRAQNGKVPRGNNVEWSHAMDEICSVEQEVFGNFTGVGGTGDDNEGDGDENDGDDNMAEEEEEDSKDTEQNSASVHTFNNNPSSNSVEMDVKPFINSSRGPSFSQGQTNRQMSSHSTAASNEDFLFNNITHGSPNGSNGAFSGRSNNVVTPPTDGTPSMIPIFSSSPSAIAAPFNSVGTSTDQVSTWATEQMLMQYAREQQAKAGVSSGGLFTAEHSTAPFARNGNAVLDVTQQMLNAHHPTLAASVFPPPINSDSPTNDLGFSGSFLPGFSLPNSNSNAINGNNMTFSSDQLEHWQKMVLGGNSNPLVTPTSASSSQINVPTMDQLRNAIRAGMSVGMNLAAANGNGPWPNN